MSLTRGSGPFGVATNAYGAGMLVADRFMTLKEAQQFCWKFLPGGAVICTFSDGRWRKLKFVKVCPAEPSVAAPGDTEVRCERCGGRVWEHHAAAEVNGQLVTES